MKIDQSESGCLFAPFFKVLSFRLSHLIPLQAILRTCEFVLKHQQDDGGWGESYLSCQNKVCGARACICACVCVLCVYVCACVCVSESVCAGCAYRALVKHYEVASACLEASWFCIKHIATVS
jgi:hypothetical protein